MSLQFDFPTSLTAEKFIAKLSDKASVQLVSRQYSLKTYYDSFDWRLYTNGISCEFNRSKTASTLLLRNLDDDLVIASVETGEAPMFSQQLPSEEIRHILTPLLEMRALSPVCNLDYEIYNLNIINNDEKTVLRLTLEEHELFNNRITLQPIKGYDKAAEQIIEIADLLKAPSGVQLLGVQVLGKSGLNWGIAVWLIRRHFLPDIGNWSQR